MSGHTPGPWYFDEDDRAVGPVANIQIGVCSIMLADGNTARYHFGEQSIANANLIAAAPDLLEALELLTTAAEYGSYAGIDAIRKAQTSIARAKGEA